MAEWVIPVEHETGIPLVFAPRYDLPKDQKGRIGVADWHHSAFPRSRESLDGVSGKAVRAARVQYVDSDEHRKYHHYFNDYFKESWDIPKTWVERFGMSILLSAGYIPELSIRCRTHAPEYVRLSERQRELLWERNTVRVESEWEVYKFMKIMVLGQKLEDVDELLIDEFFFGDESQRHEVGDELIYAAAERATEDVRPRFLAAYAGRLLIPTVPADPKDYILESKTMLGSDKRRRKARTVLRLSLAKQHGIDLPDAA